ncbi:HIG1 domain-containing protein [Paenirhodobacter populi]|uniref:HIG1 domain-containing protein n=1 Tax=Paenirhodobacter populi TaxID=2306993 RepID=A0A443J1S3_9RHOB|nr:HIG1 domain-containing protein [Sinirhodobacter populi]RWR08240.1 hypothetical protein D2T32_08890 [Sinirhodobacter populi]RWR14488.1 hypothetical protein D2T33_04610 [Sinirhodobacter populi]RWR22051.1 hypothetical protein D2T30_06785 [Sinirhodobacter populi]RWR27158.1 hypothetical protein D2T31_17940 [Sinirhodobacter populi]RWR33863.1 hypothetical protein D2T29_06285 [Sinirhodobacter populi]
MFENPNLLVMLGACVAVIFVLLAGVLVWGRGQSEQDIRRMKQLRIAAQVVAFGLIVLFILMRHKF